MGLKILTRSGVHWFFERHTLISLEVLVILWCFLLLMIIELFDRVPKGGPRYPKRFQESCNISVECLHRYVELVV